MKIKAIGIIIAGVSIAWAIVIVAGVFLTHIDMLFWVDKSYEWAASYIWVPGLELSYLAVYEIFWSGTIAILILSPSILIVTWYYSNKVAGYWKEEDVVDIIQQLMEEGRKS